MSYVDACVVPVPKRKLDEYKRLARRCAKIFKECGALEYVEAAADDVKKGKVTSFQQSVKLKAGETVVFAYIVYRSRKHRDSVMKKFMSDPRVQKLCVPGAMPFDGLRMFWGGFKTIVKS